MFSYQWQPRDFDFSMALLSHVLSCSLVWCQSLTFMLCPLPPSGGSGSSVSALVYLCGKQGCVCIDLLTFTWYSPGP